MVALGTPVPNPVFHLFEVCNAGSGLHAVNCSIKGGRRDEWPTDGTDQPSGIGVVLRAGSSAHVAGTDTCDTGAGVVAGTSTAMLKLCGVACMENMHECCGQ